MYDDREANVEVYENPQFLNDLVNIRRQIDTIDSQIEQLRQERAALAKQGNEAGKETERYLDSCKSTFRSEAGATVTADEPVNVPTGRSY